MAAPNFSSMDDTLGLYNYSPNLPAAVFGILSFVVVATVHLWRFSRNWPWLFWAMNAGIAVECVGLVARVVSISKPTHLHAFFTSYIALLLAPTFVAVACYVTFSRIMHCATPPERRQIGLFGCSLHCLALTSVLLVLTALFFTLLGASIAAVTYLEQSLLEKLPQAGLALLKTGLILQLVGFVAFSSVAVRFMLVSHYWVGSPLPSATHLRMGWRWLGWAIITAMLLLTVLAIYRIAELYSSLGTSLSYLALYEWPFWVFDTIPMLGVSTLLAIIYPGQVLPPECLGFSPPKQKRCNALENVRFGYLRAVEEGFDVDVRSSKTVPVLQE